MSKSESKNQSNQNIPKIIKTVWLLISVIFIAISQPVAALSNIVTIFSSSREEFVEVPMVEHKGVIMVPFRKVFESFGAAVTWNENNRTSRAAKQDLTVSVKIGDNSATVNGSKVTLSTPAKIINATTYVPLDLITNIPGIVLSKPTKTNYVIWDTEVSIKYHAWTQLSDGLIAHAGGGLYKIEKNGEKTAQIYTNSKEALINSYHNGHRVFEMDFLLTSDGKLAAVHDWPRVGGKKSSDEWKNFKIYDTYTSMFIEDVYQFMLEHPDAFLVTDTKSFAYSDKDKIRQFEEIVKAAEKMDKSLLNRIVPQVYDQNCYHILMEVHPFESVIYTLYESPDTDKEVVDFVAKYDNIKVVTMEWYRYTEEFYDDLTKLSKYIYFYTINVPKEIERFRSWGVHGFYTDYMNPK